MGGPRYEVEPWSVRVPGFDAASADEVESVFALGNGLLGVRGSLDEGPPGGTYLNSFFDERDMSYPEGSFGLPERKQTLAAAPDGTVLRLLVDGRPPEGTTERVLDLRAGTLDRTVRSATVRVHSRRLVSFTHPTVLAIRYRVEALGTPVSLVLTSDLRANPDPPDRGDDDPRSPTTLRDTLVSEGHRAHATGGRLLHRTRETGQRVATAVTHVGGHPQITVGPDLVRATFRTTLAPGGALTVTKFVAYAVDSGESALGAAVARGWDGLLDDQRAYLDAFWDDVDVEVGGDPPIEQAVRFGLFHLVQATAASGPRPIPSKGLTGNGYDGHTLWDTEMFVLPVLTFLCPDKAADALRWRHAVLDRARERASHLGLRGAAFPWRTIDGRESSGYWPAGSAALHINADIAAAALCYAHATGDTGFVRDTGLELLVETARLWLATGYHDDAGTFHIDGVTGPDEYTALVRDNLYTNVMARRNLTGAVEAAREHPDAAARLGVDDAEIAAWRAAADAMCLPYDDKRGVYQQCAGFTDRQEWDFAGNAEYPLLLHHPYQVLYPRQVVKQADAVLALLACDDAFGAADRARTFTYYERRTVRDSSLSAPTQAVLAAELGHLDLAHAYLGESALHDLHNLSDTTDDGLHLAALAGAWTILVMGFGGFRHSGGRPAFAPRLPDALTRLRFSVRWRDRRIRVTVTAGEATYELRDPGGPVELTHHGEPVSLHAGRAETRPIPPLPDPGPPPRHPPGRAPRLAT